MMRIAASFSIAVALLLSAVSTRAQIILGGETRATEAHFEIEGGHILLQAMLNSRGPYAFYFDTGATNALTPEVAAELGLEMKGGGYAVGFGKAHLGMSQTSVQTLKIGDFSLSDQIFDVMQLPSHLIDRGNRPRLAGLIGGDFLALFVARLDVDRRTVSFIPAGGFSYSGGGSPVSLSVGLAPIPGGRLRERPFLPVTIDDMPATNFLLDTGSGGVAMLFPNSDLARALRAKPGDRLHLIAPGGIGGPITYDLMRAGSLRLGAVPGIGQPLVGVLDEALGGASRRTEVGVLGMAALGYFNLTIDYPHNEIYLEPRHETAKPAKYAYRGSGLELTKDVQDRFVVLGVIAGSSAEKAGIAAGDEIFSVDGKPAAERTEAPISIVIGPEGRRHTVTLAKAVLLP